METTYLDFNATTPLAPEVFEAMLPFLKAEYGNPSSLHTLGRRAKEAVHESREAVASLLSATAREIVFTAGGTESDNLAILGFIAGVSDDDGRRHIVASRIEHHAVLHVLRHLSKQGFEVTFLDVDATGRVSGAQLSEVVRPDTLLVSVMVANNETGVVQPVRELADIAHSAGARFHTDAVQACGKLPVAVDELQCDLLSLSAHKFYGPKGMGALYVRKGTPFKPVFRGGGQERSRRPGTENTAGIVGLAEAARLAARHLETESVRLETLRNELEARTLTEVPDSHVNGAGVSRTPNTTNFRFDDVDGEKLQLALDRAGFAVSTGAACSAGAVEPSHVLIAQGLTPEQVQGSIRVSLGRTTTSEQTRAFADAIRDQVRGARLQASTS